MTLEKKDLTDLQASLTKDLGKAIEDSTKAALQMERVWLEKRIRQIVKEESCSCPFTSCQREVVPQFFGMIGDLGEGDYSRGLLAIRKNHDWADQARRNSEQYMASAKKAAISTVVMSIVVGILVWLGVTR